MKILSDKLKSQILIVAALSLPASVLATWSFSGSKEYTSYPVTIGNANSLGSYCLTVGWGNNASSHSLVVGQYLNSPGSYSLVVGRYNKSPSGARFVVGNGTSTAMADRKNAFEVYTDGRVVIPEPSGEIPMF